MPHFVSRRRVEFAETDMAGIVHFGNFYRWMEETEHEFFRSLGLSIMHRRDDGLYVGWPRVSANCSFEKPIRFEDHYEDRLTVERIGVKSLTFLHEFWKDGQRIASGRMKTACCLCGAEGIVESIPIPESYLAVLPEGEPEA
jgi:acyl-CoA thioester hydrolase